MMRFETRAIHAGQQPDPATGAVIVPIYATSTFAVGEEGEAAGYEYSRSGNPTRTALQDALASLEGVDPATGGGGIATASGMAATGLVGELLRPGDHLLMSNDVYGGTYRFVAHVLDERGVAWTAVDMSDLQAVRDAMRPETRLLWVETPSNPMLGIADIAAVADLAHEAGALLGVDNTFATPYLQRPLEAGADIVMHSTTKYLGGHSDIIGGALVTADPDLYERFLFLHKTLGAVPGPFDAYLTLRGLKTLAVRMERHCANAAAIAEFLASHARVEQVLYPGLPEHPGHDVAKRQMDLFGGMISFRPVGGLEAAERVSAATDVFTLAVSLGGVESLIEVPASMTHASTVGSGLEPPADLVRLSVGIEHVDDLLEDLDRALG
jgi:cystathionine gamma-synthase